MREYPAAMNGRLSASTRFWKWWVIASGVLVVGCIPILLSMLRARITVSMTREVVLAVRSADSELPQGLIAAGSDVTSELDADHPPLAIQVESIIPDANEYGFALVRVRPRPSSQGDLAALLDATRDQAAILFVEAAPILCFALAESSPQELVLTIPYATEDDHERHFADIDGVYRQLVRPE